MQPKIQITGFELKIVAIIAMTCNHVAHGFITMLPVPVLFCLYAVGGITFPIMAFLLVEGFIHTHDLKKYALRMLAFAVVAQVPYTLMFGYTANILFTLLIGLGILWLNDRFNPGVGLLAVCVCTGLLHRYVDWGTTGFVIIYMFGTLREASRSKEVRELNIVTIIATMIVPMCVTCYNGIRTGSNLALGYALVGYSIATVLLCLYRGERGRSMKWFFYAYYPLHLLVIWLITLLLN